MKPDRKLLTEIIVALYVLLFLYTSISKLKDITAFEGAMRHSPLIGNYAKLLSWLVPTSELIPTLLLIFPKTRYIGLISATIMMVIFSGYIGYMIITSPDLPCTCGGIIGEMSWNQHLWFNLTFLLLGITGVILMKKNLIMINRSSRIPAKNSRQDLNNLKF